MTLNADGTLTFSGPTGNVLLPPDYLAFMQLTDGAWTKGPDAWFITRYDSGVKILELEGVHGWRSVMLGTWGYQENLYHNEFTVPQGYVSIGQCEGDAAYTDLQLCCIPGHPDYGRVFTWMNTQDPWMTGDNMRGLGLAANSFTELMNNLTFKDQL
jgi:hypothetical protein